jgi:hypothetical protein
VASDYMETIRNLRARLKTERSAGHAEGIAAERARVVDELRDAMLTMKLYRTENGDAVLYNAVDDAIDTAAERGTGGV